MGYGSRALQLLEDFYKGKYFNLLEENIEFEENIKIVNDEIEESSFLTDEIKVRDPKTMPPLLLKLSQKKPGIIHYLGVSYGLTPQLYRFWKRACFVPVYLRQTPNDLTGEHTCVMLKLLQDDNENWLNAFSDDFHKRFLSLLSFDFRNFPTILCLNIIESINNDFTQTNNNIITKSELDTHLSPFDLKRLESYANNMLDYHTIIDMLPYIADLYFRGRFRNAIKMSGVQNAILLAIGLQRRSLEDIEKELNLPSNQVLAMLVKILRKISAFFRELCSKEIENMLPVEQKILKNQVQIDTDNEEDDSKGFIPLKETLKEELAQISDKVEESFKEKQRELINSLDLQKYAIKGQEKDWDEAETQFKNGIHQGKSSVVSIQSHSVKRKQLSITNIQSTKKNTKKKHKKT
ncbi:unnamed protein product [Pneumocystis jirovecii]|uniref:tRNA binding domain-containing protein n=1 Tax=Pneumocystis jirovecii TaxID=42068 RepID=L0PD74_PNEJI|nr:unnamed protein product [Pneumocystis jirovecii]